MSKCQVGVCQFAKGREKNRGKISPVSHICGRLPVLKRLYYHYNRSK